MSDISAAREELADADARSSLSDLERAELTELYRQIALEDAICPIQADLAPALETHRRIIEKRIISSCVAKRKREDRRAALSASKNLLITFETLDGRTAMVSPAPQLRSDLDGKLDLGDERFWFGRGAQAGWCLICTVGDDRWVLFWVDGSVEGTSPSDEGADHSAHEVTDGEAAEFLDQSKHRLPTRLEGKVLTSRAPAPSKSEHNGPIDAAPPPARLIPEWKPDLAAAAVPPPVMPPSAEGLNSTSSLNDKPIEVALNETDKRLLKNLHGLEASGKQKKVTINDVAMQRSDRLGKPDSKHVQNSVKKLKGLGLIQTKRGPDGGVWLTPDGRTRCETV
jgi:hypothetical protein